MRSSGRKRKGPEPTISVICCVGGVFARRSGMIAQTEEPFLPSAAGRPGKGSFRRKRSVRSSEAVISSARPSTSWPYMSRAPQRWMLANASRANTGDMYGQEVLGRAEEITASDDRTLRFRLKLPFPGLPAALGKNGSSVCAIMPERLAKTPPTQQITEMVGSGPFRFLPDERMAGARIVYERSADYVPRPGAAQSRLAGAKLAYFDRVVWSIIPDQATAAAALTAGEVDWLEYTNNDLRPMLDRNRALRTRLVDDLTTTILRFNWLQPPFDNPAIRRALLGMVVQSDFMTAAYGDDPAAWVADAGFFTSNSPMASKAGMEALS